MVLMPLSGLELMRNALAQNETRGVLLLRMTETEEALSHR